MSASIPEWPFSCTNVASCYKNCSNVDGAWTDVPNELMPELITSHADSVTGAGENLRELFTQQWGGSSTNLVTCTFYDTNRTTKLKTEIVSKGGSATPPSVSREHYTLSWDGNYTNLQADTSVYLVETPEVYTVTFTYYNGYDKVSSSQQVTYNTAATAPTRLTRTGYTFDSWDKSFSAVDRNLDIYAKYKPVPLQFQGSTETATIRFEIPTALVGKLVCSRNPSLPISGWEILGQESYNVDDSLYVSTKERLTALNVSGGSEPAADEYVHIITGGENDDQVACGGNIMSMLYPFDTSVSCESSVDFTLSNSAYAFFKLFAMTWKLILAPELPCKTLAIGCYKDMFWSSTITESPYLPATTLPTDCYNGMFSTSENMATIQIRCDTLGETVSHSWLKDVASSGTLKCPQSLIDKFNDGTYTRGKDTVPEGWTLVAI